MNHPTVHEVDRLIHPENVYVADGAIVRCSTDHAIERTAPLFVKNLISIPDRAFDERDAWVRAAAVVAQIGSFFARPGQHAAPQGVVAILLPTPRAGPTTVKGVTLHD